VPRIQIGPRVESETIRPSYINAPANAGRDARQLSRGLAGASDALADIAERESRIAADSADAEITSGWLKWDAENRGKFAGQNVNGYEAAATEWWDKASQQYGESLDNRAKALVGQALQRKRTGAMTDVARYVVAERKQHADNVSSAQVDAAIRFGVTTMQPDGAAEQIRGIAAEVGARNGWTTEQVQQAQRRDLATLHSTFIAKLAQSDAAGAKAYFDAALARGEIPPERQAQTEAVLKGELDSQEATRFAASIAGKPFAEQLQDAAKIEDPDRREKVLQRVQENQTLARAAQQEQERQSSDSAWQLVGQGRRVPESVLQGMDGKERVQLQDYLRAKATKTGSEVASIKTNPEVHAKLWDMMVNDPEAFKKERLVASRMGLSQSDFEQLMSKQATMRGEKTTAQQDSMLTDTQRIDGAVSSLGIDAKKKPEEAYAVRSEIDRRVRAESAENGNKPVTADRKQQIIDAVVIDKVFVDEWGRDPERPTTLLTPDEQKNAYVKVDGREVKLSSIPADDRAAIMRGLQARGVPVTEQAIARVFVARKKKQGSGSW